MASLVTAQDRLLLGLIQGLPAERVAAVVGIPEDQRDAAISEARRQLTRAADYNRDEQLGKAISRLEDCYARAAKGTDETAADVKTMVVVQKELNRLLDLYRPVTKAVDGNGRAEMELLSIRQHLAGLGLVSETASTEEMARLAVAKIIELERTS